MTPLYRTPGLYRRAACAALMACLSGCGIAPTCEEAAFANPAITTTTQAAYFMTAADFQNSIRDNTLHTTLRTPQPGNVFSLLTVYYHAKSDSEIKAGDVSVSAAGILYEAHMNAGAAFPKLPAPGPIWYVDTIYQQTIDTGECQKLTYLFEMPAGALPGATLKLKDQTIPAASLAH
jgi:hypothetical protein